MRETVVQFCQPPVAGTAVLPSWIAPAFKSDDNVPPLGLATATVGGETAGVVMGVIEGEWLGIFGMITAAVSDPELGFPAWLRITHFLNFLFLGLLIRSGWLKRRTIILPIASIQSIAQNNCVSVGKQMPILRCCYMWGVYLQKKKSTCSFRVI